MLTDVQHREKLGLSLKLSAILLIVVMSMSSLKSKILPLDW